MQSTDQDNLEADLTKNGSPELQYNSYNSVTKCLALDY